MSKSQPPMFGSWSLGVALGFGVWEWLGFGIWSLGFERVREVSRLRTWLRRPRDRQELMILGGAVAILASVWLFSRLAAQVMEGDTRQFDEWVLSSLRQPADPSQLRGPKWLRLGAHDITSLGSPTVLGLTV